MHEHGIQRTALWGRGVDSDLFHPDRALDPETAELRSRLAPNGEILLGYVGRLAPEKELHRLTELSTLTGVRLVLVGEGPSAEMLAQSLPTAHFLGRREGLDLARCYAALDAFVHTGTRETFGQTLQEASASGLPVVAPARGGPIDLIDHGRTGMLFDPDLPGALSAAVLSLIPTDRVEGAARRRQLGMQGRAAVVSRSWPELTRQLVGHYARAMSSMSTSVA